MIAMLAAAAAAFMVTITLTPLAIRFLSDRSIGQFIQDEVDHDHKRGTPTMGGLVIIVGVLAGWLFGHFDARSPAGAWQLGFREFQVPGLLVLLAFVLALASLSMGFLISAAVSKSATAVGIALFLWLLLVFWSDKSRAG